MIRTQLKNVLSLQTFIELFNSQHSQGILDSPGGRKKIEKLISVYFVKFLRAPFYRVPHGGCFLI